MRQAKQIDLPITLDRSARLNLSRQLYEELRGLILSGRLAPGSQMPSSRVLSKSLTIARSTVIESYDQLREQGYIESKNGSSTYVSRSLPENIQPLASPAATSTRTQALIAGSSSYARRLSDLEETYPFSPELDICFYPWRIARDATSLRQFVQLQAKISRKAPLEMFDYPTDQLGYKPLRETIARFLYRSRGINCSANQILILTGLPQAGSLLSRIHLDRGDIVACENPGYPPLWRTFQLEGASVITCPVDENGLDVDYLTAQTERVRLVHTTPTHQFPTGSLLSLTRRMELLSWANKTGTIIVEDEHDSEFAYGKPAPALKALDQRDLVIFLGSFAKTLFPSVALAYMVLPECLVDVYTRARELASDQIPILVQATMREFMHSGLFSRHVRRMRTIYGLRRTALLQAINEHLSGRADVRGYESGLHMLVRLNTKLTTEEIVKRAQDVGVSLIGTKRYYEGTAREAEFVMGYADLTERKINEGIKRLARVLD
jgi:GntR family transcriptional regulator/MocR family aminotransferase